MNRKMPDHITDGPQTPEDAADMWDTIFGRLEPRSKYRCPDCGRELKYRTLDAYDDEPEAYCEVCDEQ